MDPSMQQQYQRELDLLVISISEEMTLVILQEG